MTDERDPKTNRQLLSRLWVLIFASILAMSALTLVRPTITYKLVFLDTGTFTVGLSSALYALLPLLCIAQFGSWAQRAQSIKPLLLLGAGAMATGCTLAAIAGNVPLLLAGVATVGLGQLVFMIGGQASIARFVPNRLLDKAFGWFTAGLAAGQMIGPLVGGALLSRQNPQGSTNGADANQVDFVLWCGATGAGAVVLVLLLAGDAFRAQRRGSWHETGSTDGVREVEQVTVRKVLGVRTVKSYMLASAALLSMVDILMAFLPLIADNSGLSPFWVGILLSVRAGAGVISRIALPVMRRSVSRETLVVSALWISGVALCALPVSASYPTLSVTVMAVAGFFLGLGQPLTMAQVTRAVPFQWRSTALSVRLLANRVGQVVVPLSAGAIAGAWGPGAAVWLACALLLGSGTEQSFRRARKQD